MIVFVFVRFLILPQNHLLTLTNLCDSLYHNYVCIFVLVYTCAFVYFCVFSSVFFYLCVFFSCVLLRLGHVQSAIHTVLTLTANYDSLNSGRDHILYAQLPSAGNLFNFAVEPVPCTE